MISEALGIGLKLTGIGTVINAISEVFDSPGAKIFSIVLKDIGGVMGQTLSPIFRIFSTSARMVGDTLATIQPLLISLFSQLESGFIRFRPVFQTAMQLVVGVTTAFKSFVESLGDFISSMASGATKGESSVTAFERSVDSLAQALIGATVSATVLTDRLMPLAEALGKLGSGDFMNGGFANLGTELGKLHSEGKLDFSGMFDEIEARTQEIWIQAKNARLGSSVGKGNFAASYTDLESFEKKAREAAYSMGQGVSIEEQRVSREKRQLSVLERVEQNTATLPGLPGKIGLLVAGRPPVIPANGAPGQQEESLFH